VRILVLGKNGQLARSLAAASMDVANIAMIQFGRSQFDLERPVCARRIEAVGPDLIINTAAYTGVDSAEDEPDRAFRVNGEAPGEIAAVARHIGCGMIHISTDYVFAGKGNSPLAEDHEQQPLGVYGQSKALGEQRVLEAFPGAMIVRTAWLHSRYGHNFVQTMLGLAERRDVLTVVGDQYGSPTSAEDLAEGLIALAWRWNEHGRKAPRSAYHVAGQGRASWAELAQEAMEQASRVGATL
jgi:dTDP-4-dehydrorhamnose reductase